MIEPGHQRRGLSVIAPEIDHLHGWVGSGNPLQRRLRSIAAAVVDEDDLAPLRQGFQHWANPLIDRTDISLLVEDRDDNRDHEPALFSGCSLPSSPSAFIDFVPTAAQE